MNILDIEKSILALPGKFEDHCLVKVIHKRKAAPWTLTWLVYCMKLFAKKEMTLDYWKR
jgi:hypothetical protein